MDFGDLTFWMQKFLDFLLSHLDIFLFLGVSFLDALGRCWPVGIPRGMIGYKIWQKKKILHLSYVLYNIYGQIVAPAL